jgi:hypothetical protein
MPMANTRGGGFAVVTIDGVDSAQHIDDLQVEVSAGKQRVGAG